MPAGCYQRQPLDTLWSLGKAIRVPGSPGINIETPSPKVEGATVSYLETGPWERPGEEAEGPCLRGGGSARSGRASLLPSMPHAARELSLGPHSSESAWQGSPAQVGPPTQGPVCCPGRRHTQSHTGCPASVWPSERTGQRPRCGPAVEATPAGLASPCLLVTRSLSLWGWQFRNAVSSAGQGGLW